MYTVFRFGFYAIVSIFVIALFTPQASRADTWDDHVKPSLTDGFDTKGFMIIGAGALAVFLVQPHDHDFWLEWGDHRKMSKDQSRIGDIMGTGAVGAAIAITQLIFDHDKGVAHSEALVSTALATYALKYANGRNRPSSNDKRSMPSGHTSTMFATATSLTYSYGWLAAIPGYAAAVWTGLSRVSDNAHWLSDTLAGATVGIFWGRATSLHHLGITPAVTSNSAGANWVYRW